MKKGDWIIIFLAIFLAGGGFLLSGILGSGDQGQNAYAVVTLQGEEVLRRPLMQEIETYEIQGDLGTNTVEIGSGWVRVSSADCRDQLCVRQGKAQRPNQPIICLPHQMVIRIEGQQGGGVDAVAE